MDAQAVVQATKAALAELERREQAKAAAELELTAARDRHRSYLWAVNYLEALLEIVRLQEQVRAASDRLGAVGTCTRAIGVLKAPGVGRPLAWDVGTLDDLMLYLPEGRMNRFPISSVDDFPKQGLKAGADNLEARIARCQELAAREADKLAELERAP